MLALIHTSFRQAIDLIENPLGALEWNYQDPVILESQGQISRLIVRSINTLAAQRPDLDEASRRRGKVSLSAVVSTSTNLIDTN